MTPYMHVFAYHVPDQIREYDSVKQFSWQSLRRITMMPNATTIQGIDRHNAARDILLTEARMEKLEEILPLASDRKGSTQSVIESTGRK